MVREGAICFLVSEGAQGWRKGLVIVGTNLGTDSLAGSCDDGDLVRHG